MQIEFSADEVCGSLPHLNDSKYHDNSYDGINETAMRSDAQGTWSDSVQNPI